ncbi:MAG: substrate-binding domain-containing protein [Devosia sp.]
MATGVVAITASWFGASLAEDKIVIGFVTHHHLDQFQERIWQGARTAAADLGVELKLAAPDNVDPEAQLAIVQSLVNSGVSGIATPATSESLVAPLNAIIDGGTPVVTFLLNSPNIRAPFVGERTFPTWKEFGKRVATKLGADAKGEVLVGYCSADLEILAHRADGTIAGLKEAGPGLTVLGPFDVKLSATENYAAWEALALAHPNAVAMLDLCAPGIVSLSKLKTSGGYNWLIAGADTTPENLAAVEAGTAWMAEGQSEFLQGYMPVLMLVDAIRSGKKAVEPSFFDSGNQFVTLDNADEPYDLKDVSFKELVEIANSPELTAAHYKASLENGQLKDWKSLLQPLENQNK